MAGKKKPNAKNERLGIVVANDDGSNVEIYYHQPERRTKAIFNTRMTSRELQDRSMQLVDSVIKAGDLHEHPEFSTWLKKLNKLMPRR
jgi:hypothetical protein